MKKILLVFIIFIILSIFAINNKNEERTNEKKERELRSIFISYMELNNNINNKSEKESKTNIDNMINNIKKSKFNSIILQIRSHNDAIYKSKMFKVSPSIILDDGTNYDVLEYFQKKCRKHNLDLFVWMNPYRIGTKENISKKEWLNTTNIQQVKDIYYYNPASVEVQNYLVEAVEEVIKNYDIYALLFDDYFYPSDSIDEKEYQEYLKTNKFITKEAFHLTMVNNFIKKVYQNIKKENKNILFGISPEGNIDNNYNKNYADVKLWTKEDGYIDFIMPQLYYGFFNSTKPYYETLKEWNAIITNKNISLYVALSFYKVGMTDQYAKDGYNEWVDNSDIIKKQILTARNYKKYKGFALFRYDNLFTKEKENQNTNKEFSNVINILE